MRRPRSPSEPDARFVELEAGRHGLRGAYGVVVAPRPKRSWDVVVPIAVGGIAILALAWANGDVRIPISLAGGIVDAGSGRPAGSITVVDGDTIRVGGRLTRLVGFNAPEISQPTCEAERSLGKAATARLRQLLDTSTLSFTEVPCACAPGTHGTPRCNYGRACGTLWADGRDVGDVLMAEGLAVSFVCGRTSCPSTPRP